MDVIALILVALLGAGLGFLIAKLMNNDSGEDNTAELASALTRQHSLESGNKELNEKLGASEKLANVRNLEKQVATTEKGNLEKLNSELKRDKSGLEAKLEEERDRRHDAENKAKSFETQIQANETAQDSLQSRFDEMKTEREGLQERYNSMLAEHTELKTAQEEREKHHEQQVEQFDKQKEALSEQFQVLANNILESKTKALQESSKLSLTAVMNPFQETITGFKKEVQDIHHRESVQRGELKQELETLKELNQKITTEAHELSTALRGQKKLQGNWGELVLENVLDRSGLQLGKDYKREVSITTEEGRQRPDVVVYLPQEKHLIIDAKVSLAAYTRYINSEDDAERTVALAEHVKAMKDRINELADKDYYKLPGLNSPEIVFMFVPIESAFVEAFKADESLFQSAIENNVLVATPTTLLTSLNIIRQLWRYEEQNMHTVALAEKAEKVFKKLSAFLESFEGVKRGLDRAAEAYGKAEGQLVSGRGNLVKQVGEFKNLAPAIKAELPTYFTDKSELEIDYIPASEQLDSADDSSSENNAISDKDESATETGERNDVLESL
jgi:DNA recombination protein RmuC